ncbi:hypothetical protein EDD21DRAFT_363431 [Dissophora ornata]|nr:hypothetical protein EDD21DRAFT_363431 [Dissophora ornata]
MATSKSTLSPSRKNHQPPAPPPKSNQPIAKASGARPSQPPKNDAASLPQTYNILLLGETQSGKSTFVEAVRKFADEHYVVDHSAIGNGNVSHTSQVRRSSILTSLPTYEVVETSAPPAGAVPGRNYLSSVIPRRLDYGRFIHDLNLEDFEDELNRRKGVTIRRRKKRQSGAIRFNLLDTPGLNDTNNSNELHVAKIFDAILRAGKIHLVLITVGKGPFSPGLRNAIRAYMDLFPEFNGIMAFLHTKIDYKDLHPKQCGFREYMNEKSKVLHEIMGRNSFPHFLIDCDLETKKPIQKCITQNTIRKILKLAEFNRPVSMNRTIMKKTPTMKETDSLVKDKYKGMSKVMEETLLFKDQQQGEILAEIYRIESEINQIETKERVAREFLLTYDVGDLEVLAEARFDQDWEPAPGNVVSRMVIKNPPGLKIDDRRLMIHSVSLKDERGGEGHEFWETNYTRQSYQNGVLHAKLYVKRSNKHQKWIIRAKEDINEFVANKAKLIQQQDLFWQKSKVRRQEIDALLYTNRRYLRLVNHVSQETLRPQTFHALVQRGSYLGTPTENLNKVVEVYSELVDSEEREPEQEQAQEQAQEIIAAGLNNCMESDDEGDVQDDHMDAVTSIMPGQTATASANEDVREQQVVRTRRTMQEYPSVTTIPPEQSSLEGEMDMDIEVPVLAAVQGSASLEPAANLGSIQQPDQPKRMESVEEKDEEIKRLRARVKELEQQLLAKEK